ncbi:hypothetical protein BCR41DRAFT_362557 [Lobosporangium transversale]|uniref:F-box domain-containing protein n=1 Tax=Lobosporangium transversale TaxID=64571 RepID=A0A1Y2GBV5_9FUNG|nr:hypothetical protein BCR41DRAFT_362557 [Lobosporangium transversale]ORZ04718.1 hypothetical protein BCR41DRAFT_362557 [Lobosporangium transversale]|eukprot:XP_021876715.1 hypothetical protein BCR41DRAFT_362557 [Lobosporangium transversale]
MMTSLNLNPLCIPEIVLLIGSYLEWTDLSRCIRVSRIFHDTLVKTIWKKITVSGRSSYPTSEALRRYKEYIECLEFHHIFPKEYMTLHGCGRLRQITCNMDSSVDSSTRNDLSNLIKVHSSTITEFRSECSSLREIWEALLKCTHLENLAIHGTDILEDEVDLFFQVCKNIGALDMSEVLIAQLPSDFLDNRSGKFIFPNISAVRFFDTQIVDSPHPHTSSVCLGMLTRRCPRLRSLDHYNSNIKAQPRKRMNIDFYRTVFLHHPYTLTNLSDLHLTGMEIKDKDMAALLRQMTELRWLEAPDCDFGPLSIRELLSNEQEVSDNGRILWKRRDQRLCDTVEGLEFNIYSTKADGVVQAILSNCPRLKELTGPKITVAEIVDGAEWVCTYLSILNIQLEAAVDRETSEGMRKQRVVFKQLGRLTRLKHLHLTGGILEVKGFRTLDLKLGAGLDELVTLKDLHSLSFEGDEHQEIQAEDAAWMVNNWSRLELVSGVANQDRDACTLVNGIFKLRNVILLK